MTNTKFTVEEFNAQIVEFRHLFGTKDFWAKSVEMRDLAVKGLSHCYFNTTCSTPKEIAYIADILEQTLTEYSRRGLMLGIET